MSVVEETEVAKMAKPGVQFFFLSHVRLAVAPSLFRIEFQLLLTVSIRHESCVNFHAFCVHGRLSQVSYVSNALRTDTCLRYLHCQSYGVKPVLDLDDYHAKLMRDFLVRFKQVGPLRVSPPCHSQIACYSSRVSP